MMAAKSESGRPSSTMTDNTCKRRQQAIPGGRLLKKDDVSRLLAAKDKPLSRMASTT